MLLSFSDVNMMMSLAWNVGAKLNDMNQGPVWGVPDNQVLIGPNKLWKGKVCHAFTTYRHSVSLTCSPTTRVHTLLLLRLHKQVVTGDHQMEVIVAISN